MVLYFNAGTSILLKLCIHVHFILIFFVSFRSCFCLFCFVLVLFVSCSFLSLYLSSTFISFLLSFSFHIRFLFASLLSFFFIVSHSFPSCFFFCCCFLFISSYVSFFHLPFFFPFLFFSYSFPLSFLPYSLFHYDSSPTKTHEWFISHSSLPLFLPHILHLSSIAFGLPVTS